jgi:hypothetical protein
MKYLGILAVLLVAVMLLGCAGSQQTTPPAPQQPAGGQPAGGQPSGGQQPAAGVPSTGTPQTTEPGGQTTTPAATSDSGFDAIAAKFGTVDYKATYETTVAGQKATSLWVVKGKNMRQDATAQGYTTSIYTLDKLAYLCMDAGMGMTCYKTELPTADVGVTVAQQASDYTILPLPPRTIAGILGSCWSVSGGSMEGTGEICYSADGILLYSSGKAQGQTIVTEAKSVQIGNIADSEFTLPAEPTSLPTGYGG